MGLLLCPDYPITERGAWRDCLAILNRSITRGQNKRADLFGAEPSRSCISKRVNLGLFDLDRLFNVGPPFRDPFSFTFLGASPSLLGSARQCKAHETRHNLRDLVLKALSLPIFPISYIGTPFCPDFD